MILVLQILILLIGFVSVGYSIYCFGSDKGFNEGWKHGKQMGRAQRNVELRKAQDDILEEERST